MIQHCIDLGKALAAHNTYVRINDHRSRCTDRTHWWSADLVQNNGGGAADRTFESGSGETVGNATANLQERLWTRLCKIAEEHEEKASEARKVLATTALVKSPPKESDSNG
jgi:hypothetical protein